MITNAGQDYIKAILRLENQNINVSTSSLATNLGVTAASVSGMLKKLSDKKMVNYRQYRGVRLTKNGRRSALEVLRRHRLIELFLIEVLNMPWESVHHEAEVLEHVISDQVLANIDKVLDYPKHDPHGSPIPSPTGAILPTAGLRLDQMEVGQGGMVCEVLDDNQEMLQHLKKIGLVPGVRIKVNEVYAIDGTLKLKCNKQVLDVSSKVASVVWIKVN